MIERFADPERGGFFTTSHDHEELIARRKDLGDHPIPSGNSSAALGLLRLAELTGERSYEEQAVAVLRLLSRAGRPATRTPSATSCRPSTSTSRPTREVALVAPAATTATARHRLARARRRRALGPPPPHRARGRRRGQRATRAAPASATAVEGAAGGLRLRALRLQGPGDGRGRASEAAGTRLARVASPRARSRPLGTRRRLLAADRRGDRRQGQPPQLGDRADPRLRRRAPWSARWPSS